MTKRSSAGWLILCAIAGVAGVSWRQEIESHGWAGLGWVGYFHYAVPFSVFLFLVWATIVGRFQSVLRRVLFLASASVVAGVLGVLSGIALLGYFGGGPNMSLLFSPFGSLVFVMYPGVPLCVCLLARLFGLRVSWVRGLSSVGVFLLAFPLGWLAVRFIEPALGDYSIHAIKTGYIVPALVIGLGIPFLGETHEA